MFNIILMGFNDLLVRELKKSDRINVAFWIGKNEAADIHNQDIQHIRINYNLSDNKSIEIHNKLLKTSFSTFINMNARRDPENQKSVYDYTDIFNIYFYFYYNMLTTVKTDWLITSCIPHTGPDFIAYKVAKELKIRIIILHQSILKNRFFYMHYIEQLGKFNELESISSWEKYIIENNQRTYLPYMKNIKRNRYSIIKLLVRIIKRSNAGPLWQYGRHIEYKRNLKKLENKYINYHVKYIYFPLHLNPELTTAALGGEYTDQVLAIERLSYIIPIDYKIYVKENPKQTEFMRGKWFFRRIKKIENVKIISSKIDTYELIKNSEFVATITGTAGWEAITSGKKALVFGNAWYRSLPGVFEYNKIKDIYKIIEYKIDIKKLEKEICNILCKMGRGVVDPGPRYNYEGFDPDKNSKGIAETILKIMEK